MNPPNFFAELKRRNVYKVAVAYAVVGWLIAQIATQIFPFLEIPNWVVRLVILFIAIGFPIALIIAWAFEATPEGVKRTDVADAMPVVAAGHKKHAWIYVAVIAAILSMGLFFLGRFSAGSKSSASSNDVSNKSIAVLPFENLSSDKENAYFAEGIQDEILTRLAKIEALKVISRTSTQHFKSMPDNLPQIAKQLGVANILEGSVQKSNDQVRVTVQLINALTDTHLWAEIYDRKLTDIFAVESDIAKTIAETLRARLTGAEESAIAARPTENSEAHQLYLKGRYFFGKRRGADDLKRAIELDPVSVVTNSGLGWCYNFARRYPEAIAQFRKAAELDPSFPRLHIGLGLAYERSGQREQAIAEYQRAYDLGQYPEHQVD